MIIGLFALAAGLSRPFSGRIVDHVGRKPVMVIGALVCIAMGALYPLILNVQGFLILRFLHGFSTGFNPTGSVSYLADIIPANKRGEAMGILGMVNNLGMSIGPAMGSEVAKAYSVDHMFMVSALFAVISMVLIFKLPETLKNNEKLQTRHLKIKGADIYEPQVKLPAVVMTLTVFTFGAVLTLIPDHAKQVGLQKQGYFFTVMTLTSVLVRLISGRLSDKYGRRPIMIFGVIALIFATILLGLSSTVTSLFVAAAVFGIATGTNSPTLFAWCIDLGNRHKMGRAISTLFISLELGIVLGSFIPAAIYNNEPANMPFAFWSGTFAAIIALMVLLRAAREEKKRYMEAL